MSDAQVKAVKQRKVVNPINAMFRERTNPKRWRIVRCFRIDETPDSWACQTKVFAPGHHYVRYITEWFQKSMFEHVKHGYRVKGTRELIPIPKKRRGRPPKVSKCASTSATTEPMTTQPPIIAPPVAPPAPESNWAAENPALAAMSEAQASAPKPKSPPPAIPLAEDDEEDDPNLPVPPVSPPSTPTGRLGVISDRAEYPKEYNPRAHPEQAAGKIEDLVVFDDLVNANFIAARRKEKLEQLRHRARVIPTQADPLGVKTG